MGNGASSPTRAAVGSTPRPRAPSSAPPPTPRAKKVLVNASPRAPPENFLSPSALAEASVSRQARRKNPETRSTSLQQSAVHRRQGTPTSYENGRSTRNDEEALRAFTRNADPVSLRILELLEQVDTVSKDNPVERLELLRECYPLLESVPKCRFDQLAVTVYQKEGDIYYQQGETESAKSTYSRAIVLAEKRVARQETDMYMVLKRYVLAMVGLARIWYHHERDHEGFVFVDGKHPKVMAVDRGDTATDAGSSMSSLEDSLLSDGGSVFSLNEAILRSMAPRPPRRQTGPLFQRVKMRAPHAVQMTAVNREDEFVLHSRMTRELVASPCELLLLRCCEVVQIGHNSQSELLIPPQIELAQMYEDLELYSRALLLVRRCVGILCSVFDYDHPWVVQLMQRTTRVEGLLGEQTRNDMATKIQSTWKMYRAMQQLESALGRPVRRHLWVPRKYRPTPDLDFLSDYVNDMPADGFVGSGNDDELYGDSRSDKGVSVMQTAEGNAAEAKEWAMVPQIVEGHDPERARVEPHRPPGATYETHEGNPPYIPGPLLSYAPAQHTQGGDTFMTMVPNATVVGTTQDTQTDTHIEHTEYGDVLTVRTTTVTKTITEDLVDSEDDVTDDEDSSEYEELQDAPQPLKTLRPALPPDQQQQQQQQQQEEEEEALEKPSSPSMPAQRQYRLTPPSPSSQREGGGRKVEPHESRPMVPQSFPPPHKAKRAGAQGPSVHMEDEPPRTTRQVASRVSPPPPQRESGGHPIPEQRMDRAPPQPASAPVSTQRQQPLGEPFPAPSHIPTRPVSGAKKSSGAKKAVDPWSSDNSAAIVRVPDSRRVPESGQPPMMGRGLPSHLYRANEESHTSSEEDAPGEVIPGRNSVQSPSALSRSHVPILRPNSAREQFPPLVQPNAAYPMEPNGFPIFQPPHNYRGRSGSSSRGALMPHQNHEAQSDTRSRGHLSEAPAYPPTESNSRTHVSPQARKTKKISTCKITKTRRVRTYMRNPRDSSDRGGSDVITRSSSGSVEVEEQVSNTSWESDSPSVTDDDSNRVESLGAKYVKGARDPSKSNNASATPSARSSVKATSSGK